MSGAPSRVHANDVTPRVDVDGLSGGGAREVGRREVAMRVKQKAMSGAASSVLANDVTLRVDPEGACGGGAREVNRREVAMRGKQIGRASCRERIETGVVVEV